MIPRRDLLKALPSVATVCLIPNHARALSRLAGPETGPVENDELMRWWQEARFGLFLHWGLYSVAAGEWKGRPAKGAEHFMLYERIPLKEYAQLARALTLEDYDPDHWAKLAREAGMKYLVVTAKHHEGFAMFDSPSSPYNIVKMSPYGKDPMKPLAEACRRHGLRLCFYYSLGRDWQDPDVPTNWPAKAGRSNTWDYPDEDSKVFGRYFERKVKPQIRELLTQYGPVGVLWFDTPELIPRAASVELRAMIRALQPNCIVNSRIGNGQGDYDVAEQELAHPLHARPWEACMTMSRNWGYNKFDHAYKSPEVLVRDLVEVVSAGGNFLLDAGPTAQGTLTPEATARMQALGKWMAANGEAIHGTHAWVVQGEDAPDAESPAAASVAARPSDAGAMKDAVNDSTSNATLPDLRFTARGNAVYVIARSWRQPRIVVRSFAKQKLLVGEVAMLGSKRRVRWRSNQEQLMIEMPQMPPGDLPVYVFRVIGV